MQTHDAVTQYRSDRAVDISDRQLDRHSLLVLDGIPRLVQDLPVQMRLQRIRLRAHAANRPAVRGVRRGQHGREIQPTGLEVLDRRAAAQLLDPADHLLKPAEAQFRHDLPDLFSDEQHEPLDVLGPTGKPLP